VRTDPKSRERNLVLRERLSRIALEPVVRNGHISEVGLGNTEQLVTLELWMNGICGATKPHGTSR
jgi:hypothetical protein